MIGETCPAEGSPSVAPADKRTVHAHQREIRPICAWCSHLFTARRTGGKPQRFCSERCRRASEKAMRNWAREQLTEGRVTLAELQRPARHTPAHLPTEALLPDAATPGD
jgi:hypothetical protein